MSHLEKDNTNQLWNVHWN